MTKGARDRGFTLIELIVFIIVAGIFIPMAYIAFMAATRGSLSPEAVVSARFLAERKLEDITKDTYLNLQAEQASYIAVPGYTGYQWRWTIQNIAYQGRTTHGAPTISAPESWQANQAYRVGDYVSAATTLPTTRFYRCIPRDRWRANSSYAMNSYVSPTAPNNLSYRATARLLSSFPLWQPSRPYTPGDYVVPTISTGHSYRCTGAGTSGAAEASPWPLSGSFIDGTVTWIEDTNTLSTGIVEPTPWPANPGDTVNDGSVTWMTEQMRSAGVEPGWPITGPVNDGSLRWQESTAYKSIIVYVREPKGYEYIVNSIVTARPGAYP
jgi:type II secretory pathway pseudopilin PulG